MDEAAVEAFLARHLPGADQRWRGAAPEQIDALERIAGQPLPLFYRWFLRTMGEDMGDLRYEVFDFRPIRLLEAHASGAASADGALMIAHSDDPMTPLHYFYDLEQRTDDDAWVFSAGHPVAPRHPQFASLREMLAWGVLTTRHIHRQPCRCEGLLKGRGVRQAVTDIMLDVGFIASLPDTPSLGLFEAHDQSQALSFTSSPGRGQTRVAFDLGGPSAGALRETLGYLALADIEVKVGEWHASP